MARFGAARGKPPASPKRRRRTGKKTLGARRTAANAAMSNREKRDRFWRRQREAQAARTGQDEKVPRAKGPRGTVRSRASATPARPKSPR